MLLVLERVDRASWDRVRADVAPFLEVSTDLTALTQENLARLLAR